MMEQYESPDQEQITNELFHKVQRYHTPKVASIIVGLYNQTAERNGASDLWPREGVFWIKWLQRQDLGDQTNPIDLDDSESAFDTKWKEEYISSALHLICEWDKHTAYIFTRDITHNPELICADVSNLMKWDTLMKWMLQQDMLDEVEQFLLHLYHLRQEREGLSKVRGLLHATEPASPTYMVRVFERYFLFSESLELIKQVNGGVIPVEKYARIQESIEEFEQSLKKGWEFLKELREEWDHGTPATLTQTYPIKPNNVTMRIDKVRKEE